MRAHPNTDLASFLDESGRELDDVIRKAKSWTRLLRDAGKLDGPEANLGRRLHHTHRQRLEAGGVGLNIQAASVVIIAEPQWKPSTEQLAIARAHRMGQVQTVQVHRILAKDSIDGPMREVLLRKSGLFDEYARKSLAKDADPAAVDASWSESQPSPEELVRGEQVRLGMQTGRPVTGSH